MTEEEAETKWCPFARPDIGANALSQRQLAAQAFARTQNRCIASACMAWRWSEPKRTAAFLEAVQKHMQGQPKPNFNTALQAVYAETGGQFERVEGSCGLAGQPS